MDGRRSATAALLAAALAAAPVYVQAGPGGTPVAMGASFGARFALTLTSPGAAPQRSEGSLYLLPDGRFCVRVARPVRQDVLLAKDRILVHYPERALVLEGEVRKGQIPPVLDAVVAGLGEASRLMPSNASLASRTVEGGILRTLWTLPTEAEGGGTIEVAERAEGLLSLEVRGKDGKVRRRYDFGPRQAAARLGVPTTVRAEYRDRKGELSRTEDWTLEGITAGVPDGLARDCSGEGTSARREVLEW